MDSKERAGKQPKPFKAGKTHPLFPHKYELRQKKGRLCCENDNFLTPLALPASHN